MSLREAAQAALEALCYCAYDEKGFCIDPDAENAYKALRAALAEAEKAEPVAFDDDEVLFVFDAAMTGRHWWSGGAWLYPGDTVVVRRAAARGKG